MLERRLPASTALLLALSQAEARDEKLEPKNDSSAELGPSEPEPDPPNDPLWPKLAVEKLRAAAANIQTLNFIFNTSPG